MLPVNVNPNNNNNINNNNNNILSEKSIATLNCFTDFFVINDSKELYFIRFVTVSIS